MAILTRMEIGMTVIGMGIVTAIAMATTTVDYTAGGISMTATMMVIATATAEAAAGADGCQPAINRISTATTRAGCNTAASASDFTGLDWSARGLELRSSLIAHPLRAVCHPAQSVQRGGRSART